jgi:hypothetical protein
MTAGLLAATLRLMAQEYLALQSCSAGLSHRPECFRRPERRYRTEGECR